MVIGQFIGKERLPGGALPPGRAVPEWQRRRGSLSALGRADAISLSEFRKMPPLEREKILFDARKEKDSTQRWCDKKTVEAALKCGVTTVAVELVAKGGLEALLRKASSALGFYEKALTVSPNYVSAYGGYACSLAELGRTDEGLAAINKALELFSSNGPEQLAYMLHIRAYILEKMGNLQPALKDMDGSLENTPSQSIDLIRRHKDRGRLRRLLGDADGTEADLKEAAKLEEIEERREYELNHAVAKAIREAG